MTTKTLLSGKNAGKPRVVKGCKDEFSMRMDAGIEERRGDRGTDGERQTEKS